MGYLGKISAVVSASTADFDAKLAKSAKEVGAFASRVQTNLTSASRSAAKALEGIYTPMQKFERSLQAAGSLKLSFKGFPGMIRDLDSLQARLNSALSARQVAIVLRTTGMESVEKVRQSLNGLKSKDVEIIANFGGLEKLKELQKRVAVDVDVAAAVKRVSEMDAAFAAAKKKVGELNAVPVGPKVSTAGLDTLRQELQKTTTAAGRLMGGEYTGQRSLEKSIAGVSEKLLKAQQDLMKATAVRDALLAGASGKNANPADLKKAQSQVDAFTEENKSLAEQLKTLEGYRDQIKKLRSDIRRAESVASSPSATGEDRAKAFKDMEAAQRAATKAAKDLQRQLTARYGLSISVADLNELIARGSKAGDLLQRLKPLMDNLGKSDFSVAADRMRKMQSVAVQITEPLKAAVGKLAGLGVAVESAFSPALKNTQKNVEALNTAIESQTRPSAALDKYFLDVQSQVERTIQSIERLNEVSLLASQTKTGKEFVFEQPVLKEALDRSASIGNQAAQLPAAAIKANPQVAESLVELKQKTTEAAAAYASLLAVMDRKTSSPKEQQAAREELERVIKKLLEAQAISEKEIKVVLDTLEADRKANALKVRLNELREGVTFTVTGKVQNLDQAKAELQRLQAELGKLDATQRAPIARKIVKLGKLVEAGDLQSLEQIQALIDRINKDVARKQRINLDAKEAREEAKQLAATLAKFRQDVAFTVTGKVQNVEQARTELGRIQSDVDKLKDSQRIEIAPKVVALGELVSGKEIQNLDQVRELIAEIKAALAADIKANVTTAEADAKLKALKERLDALRTEVRFAVTGSFSNAAQVEAEISKISGEIQKLRDDQKAAFGQRLTSVIDLLGEEKFQEAAIAAKNLRADVEQQMAINVSDKEAQDKFAALQARAAKFREENAFVITGRPQNLEQAENREASLRGEIGTLDRAQRQNFKGLLDDAATAREQGDLQKYIDLLMQIEALLRDQKQLRITTERAQAELDALNKKIDALKDNSSFAITGKVQNAAQAEAEINRIIGALGKLDAAQRAGLQTKIDAAVTSLGMKDAKGNPDVAAMQTAVEDLRTEFDKQLEIKVKADEARSEIEKLKESLASLADKIGDPSKPIDRLRQAIDKANAAVQKLPVGALRAKLEGDLAAEKTSLEAAATPGAPDPTPTMIDAAATRAAAIATAAEAGMPIKGNELGAAFGSVERNIASVKAKVLSLQGDLEKLPVPLQAQFIPAINEVRDAFARLSTSSTQAEIDAVTKKAAGLERALTRAQQAAKLEVTLGESLNTAAFTRVEKQIGFIRAKLLEVGAAANGPVADAFNRYAAFVADAAKKGTLGFASTKEQADQLAEKIGEAALAAGLFKNKAEAASFVKNIGDVGRSGVDKYSLALNQAAFAIDDLMSSTGGLEFKLRAVSNNITQLAFILGGTKGLFIGLGAVIAGQAAIGIIKWMNAGRSAEDRTKALNDALSKQKTLVDELAQSHKNLADAILRGTASGSSSQAREIAEGRFSIRSQASELSAERRAGADSANAAPRSLLQNISELYSPRQRMNEFQGVAQLMAEVNKLQKQLEAAETVGERVTIQGRIREANRSLLATRGRLASEVTPSSDAISSSMRGSADESARRTTASQRVFSNTVTLGLSALLGVNRARFSQTVASNEGLQRLAESQPSSAQGEIERLRKAQELKRPIAEQRDLGFIKTNAAIGAEEDIAKFEAMIQSLQKAIDSGIVDAASKTYAASADAAESIRAAQESVADAIKRGVPTALAFQAELDALSSELAAAEESLKTAVTANPDEQSGSQEARRAAVTQAQERVDSVMRQRADVESRAREMRLGRSFGGERTTAVLSSLDGNDRFANERAGVIATLKRAIDDEAEARRKAVQAAANEAALVDIIAKKRAEAEGAGADVSKRLRLEAEIEAAQADLEKAKRAREAAVADAELAAKASEAAAALGEAAKAIEAALARIRKLGDSAVQRSEQGADAAQRDFEENPLRGGAREARDAAEQRLIDDRARVAQAQLALDNKRREIAADPQMVAVNNELEQITQRRKDLEAKSRIENGLAPAEQGELEAAQKREIELIRQRETLARKLTSAEQRQLDAINNAIAAREKELEKNRQRAAEDPAFNRRREQAGQLIEEARRRADEAQQRFVENPNDNNRRRRDEADARLRDDRRRAQELQDNLDNKRKELERNPLVAGNNRAIKANNERLAELAAKEAAGGLTPEETKEREALEANNRSRREANDRIIAEATQEERDAIDKEAIAQNRRNRADRGRRLGLTERQAALKDAMEGPVADIRARADEMRAAGQDPKEFLKQAEANMMRQFAPMLEQFRQERETALLQGPSRAALKVNDVATTEGQSELNRLLRGDDAAKDVNLSELQKQSGLLQSVVDAIKGIAFPVVE